jgi:hypothetical protein
MRRGQANLGFVAERENQIKSMPLILDIDEPESFGAQSRGARNPSALAI